MNTDQLEQHHSLNVVNFNRERGRGRGHGHGRGRDRGRGINNYYFRGWSFL